MKTPLTLAAAALVSAACNAELVHIQQGPDYVFGSTASDSADGNMYLSTDDFTLASTAVVRTVTFTGEYSLLADVPATTDAFTIFVFADEGGLPAAAPLYQTSDATVTRTPLGDGSHADYVAELPDLVTLDPGVYWLGVQNHHGIPGRWKWAR